MNARTLFVMRHWSWVLGSKMAMGYKEGEGPMNMNTFIENQLNA